MGLLDELLGQGDQRREYENFADRFDRGHPSEGYDDDEVHRRYSEVAGGLDDDSYRLSAREAFERLDPNERRAFGQLLRERGNEHGQDFGDADTDNPDALAAATTRAHRDSPDLLTGLLAGAGGGGTGSGGTGSGGGLGDAIGGLLGGSGSGGAGGLAGNPVARAALAGIAAMAARRFLGRR